MYKHLVLAILFVLIAITGLRITGDTITLVDKVALFFLGGCAGIQVYKFWVAFRSTARV